VTSRRREYTARVKPEPTTPDPHAQARLQLLDLAEDASLYLRRSAEPSVRVAAALLLATSLAACSSPGSSSSASVAPAVAPLAQEVKEGLPTAPGTYPVSASSLTRDPQGTYGFSWRNPTGAATWNQGRSSLMKLAQGTDDTLEIPASGDPILRLKPDTPINLPDDPNPVGPTPTPRTSTSSTSSSSSSSGNRNIAWYPFVTGGGTTTAPASTGTADSVPATTPAYRNPPAAEPGQGSVRGASSSLSAPTSSARTWTSPSRAAATGQAGGPGTGTAATSRAGVAQGASRPGSSIFSGGRSGASAGSSSSGG
jgi:hypothetical protein